jgi:uncharacterized protein
MAAFACRTRGVTDRPRALAAPGAVGACAVAIWLALALNAPAPALAATWPQAHEYVNDFAGLLQPGEQQSLNAELRDYDTRTTNQIGVGIFPSLQDEDRQSAANEIFKQWKGKDNAVLIVIFVKESNVQIEVGYGLEPVLTDAISSRIIREQLVPAFREKRFADGIRAATTKMQQVIGGDALPPAPRERRVGKSDSLASLIPIALIVLIVILLIARRSGGSGPGGMRNSTLLWILLNGASMTGRRGGWSGGGFGGGGFGGGGWGGGGGGGSSGGGGWGGFSGGGGSGGGGAGGSW